MTSDGIYVLLFVANLHYTLHFAVNGKTPREERMYDKIVFTVSCFNLVTTRRIDWTAVSLLRKTGEKSFG